MRASSSSREMARARISCSLRLLKERKTVVLSYSRPERTWGQVFNLPDSVRQVFNLPDSVRQVENLPHSGRRGLSFACFADHFQERQFHGPTAPGAAGDRLGELHVGDARGEIGVADRLAIANRLDELFLNTPAAGLLGWDGDVLQFVAAGAGRTSLLRGAADTVGGEVVLQDAVAADQGNALPLAERRDAAEVVDRSRPALEDRQHLHAV